MLRVEGLRKELGDFRLADATFTVAAGDYFVLLGESGAGKTVILELLAGLLRPDGGRIFLGDAEITRVPIQRRDLALVYQDHALFPHLSVRQNIGYALPRRARGQIPALAAAVGAADLLDRRPATLSLGEAQRVALARTLARQPRVLMLDEPLASLDSQARARLRSLLRRLHRDGQTIVHVTHDYEEALALATRVAVLEGGRVSQVGTPDEVFHHPRSPFVASFVGVRNFFAGDARAADGTFRLRPGPLAFHLADDRATGPGWVFFKSEDVTLSPTRPAGSARNVFPGCVEEVEPTPRGLAVAINIGVLLYATVTRDAGRELALAAGSRLWVSFKSTALRFVPESEAG